MHEGHHGILEDPKQGKQRHHYGRSHGLGHDQPHAHAQGKPGPDMWMKVVAGVVAAGLVIGFVVWRFF